MLVAYVGNFKPSHSTENHLATTLEKLGHQVIRLQEDELTDLWITPALKCDLFLFTRTWGKSVTMEHLAILKEYHIPTVSYHLDLYVGLQRDGGIDHDPFWRTDYVFTPDGDPTSLGVFRSKSINHFYLKPGVLKDECYIKEEEIKRDLIFVGSYRGYHPEWPYRHQLIDWLKGTYSQFELWGPQGRGHVRGEELNALYAGTKIVIGDSLVKDFTHQYYWSDRVYETMGRGGFLIHPKVFGMGDEFNDREHLVFYEFGDFKGLKEKIDYYLEHDSEREKIRRQGHEFVKNNCTYTNRLQEMFEILRTEGAL